MTLSSEQMAELSSQLALSKRAEEVTILDLRGLTDIADFFVICTGNSDTHIKAITDAILEGMEQREVRPWHVEGYSALNWVLIDYVDIVVHVFQRETREFYKLERLWGDAKLKVVEEEIGVDES